LSRSLITVILILIFCTSSYVSIVLFTLLHSASFDLKSLLQIF